MIRIFYLLLLSFFLFSSCKTTKATKFDLPTPVDTQHKTISTQDKKVYQAYDVYADNEFDGARLNGFSGELDTSFIAVFTPENSPINESAHYAFRIWSDNDKRISVDLVYPDHEHRYWPKLSYDRKEWMPIDSNDIILLDSGRIARIYLDIDSKKLYVAAQEIINSTDMRYWSDAIAQNRNVSIENIGKSTLKRDLYGLDICEGDKKGKDAIVIISRQHPPEVTGQMAMMSFVDEIMSGKRLSQDFRKKYRILVYPMLNPDGVDLGHWRHNAKGIDLNRDWSQYNQKEINTVANHIVETTKKNNNQVLIGLDFHSTQNDIYYTLSDNLKSSIYDFKDYWIEGIDQSFPDYTPNDAPYDLDKPISKAWFYLQFNAEGITYEVGDETPRDFIDQKARVAAREMMKLLVLR